MDYIEWMDKYKPKMDLADCFWLREVIKKGLLFIHFENANCKQKFGDNLTSVYNLHVLELKYRKDHQLVAYSHVGMTKMMFDLCPSNLSAYPLSKPKVCEIYHCNKDRFKTKLTL